MSHPFGDMLRQYRARRQGLSQTRLAELVGYDQAILSRMAQGKKDLTGPAGRERVLRIIEVLLEERALSTQADANALLNAAALPPLFEGQAVEARLLSRLSGAAGAPADAAPHNNLPAPLAHFIGRAREIDEVRNLLVSTRLLTLTGSGGAGKTRLAQYVARDVAHLFAQGVAYTELAPITDGALVAETAAAAFGQSPSQHSAHEQLRAFLRDRQALLVLDNCEHLIDEVATFTLDLLRACPRLTILATSREALNVEGESAWRVPSMQADEAAQLFVERASAARPDLTLDSRRATIAHICRRLDGMPLAIELAAARLQGMSPAELAKRLDDCFALLSGGRRGALPRQQTLQATIDWSHALLSEPERTLFRRLAVFAGGWTAELAEQVCADAVHTAAPQSSGHLSLASRALRVLLRATDILPLLLDLVGKSLVAAEERDGETRYRFLETIREYAQAKLAAQGELTVMQHRHAQAFAALAERARMPLHLAEQRAWLARLETDYPNLHAALAWSFGPAGNALEGCRIVGSLRVFWEGQSHAVDEQRFARLARQALTDQMPPGVHAGVWMVSTRWDFSLTPPQIVAGFRQALAYYTAAGDTSGMADAMGNTAYNLLAINPHDAEGWRMEEESLALARSTGDVLVEHCSLKGLAWYAQVLGEFERAEMLYRENLRLCRETGDVANLTQVLGELCELYMQRQQYREALSLAQESVEVARQVNNYWGQLDGECSMAECWRYLGDIKRSVTINEACLAFAREKMTWYAQHLPVLTLTKALNDAGEYDRARKLLYEWSGLLHKEVGNQPSWYCHSTLNLACTAAGLGQAAYAAQLFGAADAIFASTGERLRQHHLREIAPYIARARTALGDANYETAYATGRAMTPEQAVAYALRAGG